MKAVFVMYASYNKWANDLLLQECEQVTTEEYHRNLGVFFDSIHGTMDHLYVADKVWLYRFTGQGDPIDSIDEQLTSDFATLQEKRRQLDDRICSVIDQMQEKDFLRTIIYRTVRKPLVTQQPLGAALFHFFNHQTHHRGQVHAMLTQQGRTPAALDMIYFQRETGQWMAKEEDMITA